MNGRVSVESQVGKGSTFYISMPLRHGSQVWQPVSNVNALSIPIHDEAALSDNQLQKDGQMPVLLIVEDNAEVASYIGSTLRDRYRIVYAKDGSEGLDKAKDIMPDLIITDLMMPGSIDGLEFCRKIRKSDVLSHIPIIIITAKTTDADRIKGLEAGADAYLVKPFNSEELIVRVNKLLEQRRMLRKKFSTDMVISNSTPSSNVSQQSRDFLNKFVDVVYSNMATGKLDVETIADRMAMSRTQLNRKMLAITGENTSTYIMQLRMSKAKRLLRGDINLPIGSVAQQCGFDDVAYFSRIFKQQCDLTPSQYRKSIE
jgi:DNA-binding response OmpR family regulator